MNKLFLALLCISPVATFAASSDPLEVDSLVKCGQGFNTETATAALNEAIHKPAILGIHSDFRTVVINAPFKVSAPTAFVDADRNVQICVTLTK